MVALHSHVKMAGHVSQSEIFHFLSVLVLLDSLEINVKTVLIHVRPTRVRMEEHALHLSLLLHVSVLKAFQEINVRIKTHVHPIHVFMVSV